MIYISKDRQIHVVWSIFRGTSDVHEDFSRALVKVFLIGNYEKYLLEAVAEGGNLVFDIPQGLPEGAYSLEAIWVKNYNNLLSCSDTLTPSVDSGCRNQPLRWPFKHPHDHRFNDRCIMRSRKDFVFALTEYDSESTFYKDSGEAEIKIRSAVATYGYDGLSAYEIAVLRGDFNGTEGEYLDSLKFKLEVAQEHKLGGITAVTKTDDETEEVKVDPETGRLYVKPGGGSLSVATETKLGGIKASSKTDNETVEAKIGEDGKLYVPKGGEELKTATETTLGGIRAATKTSLETQEVKIDPVTGKLYTQPGGEGGVEIVNNPDEEDLHSIEKSADVHVLQFADKEYNESSFSGLGRVYLRKNISDGKNVLTQAMMNKANTRYIIQYDYDLDGTTITVPEGCTLEFDGGEFKNGKIVGNNTRIKVGLEKIFSSSILIEGNWNIIEIYPEWYGAKGDGSSDDYQSIQQALTTAKNINIKKVSLSKEYFISSTLNVYNGTILDANGIYETWNPPSIIVNGISAIKLVPDSNTCRVRIRNFNIKNSAMSYANYGIYVEPGSDSELLGISQSLFENLLIEGFKEGIYLHISGSEGFYTNTFKQVHIGECTVGIHIKGIAVGEQADTWANYNKIESCVISHCQVGGIWLDGLRSTAVFLIDYCNIENNGSCTNELLTEYDGCFGFKFSSVNGPCIISNCYLENNIARISGELASDDLNHSALFLGTGMNIEVHSCLITSYRRVILCEGQATIKFHENRWGREYNNQALTDSLIKFKLNNYAMEFTSLVFHETINRTYSIMTGNLYSVDDYDNDNNSNNISCIAVDVNCNKFGVYKSGFDGVRYCTQLFVDEVNGHSKATGFTINDPINSLAEISKLIYNGNLHYGNELRIHINGIAHYNSYNNQYQNFGHNVRIGGYTSRDVDKLIIEDTYGIVCTGDITLAGLTIEYGEQCNSLFRLKGDNVSIFIDYSKIKGINSSKNIVYTVPNRSPYGNYSGGSLFLSAVVIDDTFSSQQQVNPISIEGNKMSYDAVNLTVPSNLSIVNKHNVTIQGKVLDGSDTSVYKGDDYRIYTMGTDYKLLTLCSFLSGASGARPTEGLPVGFMFFDTTLGKPVYWTGSKWVDSAGSNV